MSPLKVTEAQVLGLLERKHAGRSGNGPEYAFLRHVRSDGGARAARIFDGVAVNLWPSRGYTIHIFEVKVSRSDWQRELAKPAKAEDACALADHFSIVAPKGVVDLADLPPTWGLIEVTGGVADRVDGRPVVTGLRLRTAKKAPLLGKPDRPETLPRGLVASMLRAAGAAPEPQTVTERMLADAADAARQAEAEKWRAVRDRDLVAHQDLQQRVYAFQRHSGIQITGPQVTAEDLVEVGARVGAALDDDRLAAEARQRLVDLRDALTAQIEGTGRPARRGLRAVDRF